MTTKLDYGTQWTLNFNYSQTDKSHQEERKKGWKITRLQAWPWREDSDHAAPLVRPARRCQATCLNSWFSKKEVEQQALLRLISKIRKNCYGQQQQHTGEIGQSPLRSQQHHHHRPRRVRWQRMVSRKKRPRVRMMIR
ncbi:receptor-transporting protein 3-like protein [Lates japonicus]|uniref:Receptor-transporting protein 3-like protein n=1 Tax=Lates japonicus TaxID=270547 RepID=A0AAD3MS66_LATJO|nr:receptor-transporting protein 3-like protein [Lates japonicus]